MKIDLSDVKKFGNIEFLAKQVVEGFITGLHSSPYHGFSVEFAEHRLYNNGESTRHIDWKVFGKTDKLFTKRYEEETNLRCMLLVDTSSSMYYPQKNNGKITFSILAAAALAHMLQRQKDAVGLTTFSEELELQTQIKSTSVHIHSLFIKLQQLLNIDTPNRKTSIAKNIDLISEKLNKRSLIIIFSDMFDNFEQSTALFSALQHLKHNQHEVLLFHVMDEQTEALFSFEERPYEFIDMESGEQVKIQPSEVKDYYVSSLKKYRDEIKTKCGQFKIDYIPVDIEKGVDQILESYLIKRTKMK
ncbi:MAG TPA: DUF58 domain-containing protein [Cytophagaceae bacterium]|jgi:uncharacterized protein (DUF58 family)